jgi:hypothetical protein
MKKIIKKFDKNAKENFLLTFSNDFKKKRMFSSRILQFLFNQTQYLVTYGLYDGDSKKASKKVFYS